MKVKNQKLWNKYVRNKSSYSIKCIKYAEAWANLMEDSLSKGQKFEEFTKKTSHSSGIDDISVFGWHEIVTLLYDHWEYGDQLYKWHQLEWQMTMREEEEKEDKCI